MSELRYLKPPWMRNLRVSRRGRLRKQGRVEEIMVVEVPAAERAPLLEAYRARFGTMPTVARVLDALPDPADHPIFRITPAEASREAGHSR